MVEIRSFEGSAEELRDFVVSVWRNSYGGRMAFPLWTPDYFRWQLGLGPDEPRDQLLAAYDSGRLVGAVLGFPVRYRTPLGPRNSSQGSWLSVASEYRRQGVATQLRAELRRRHREQELSFQIGYGYFGSSHSLGPSFWESQRQLGTTFLAKVGFWARVLDVRRACAWNLVGWERWLSRLGGPLLLTPREHSSTLTFREFRREDLQGCLELVRSSTAAAELAIDWEEHSLLRQLAGMGIGKTLIAERAGRIVGCVNWHSLPFLGRTEEVVSVIDIVALGDLGVWDQRAVMNAALSRMRDEGAALALKLRIGDYPVCPLVLSGFIPRQADSYIMCTWAAEPESFGNLSRTHLLWR